MFPLVPRIVRAGVAGVVVTMVLLAFTVYRATDLFVPYQSDRLVTVGELPAGMSDQDLFSLFGASASAHVININKTTVDPSDPTGSRTVYRFSGAPDGQALYEHSYPAFATEMHTRVRDAADLTTQDARGIYAVAGDPRSIDSLIEDLRSQNVVVSTEHVDGAYIAKVAFMDGALVSVALGVGLCLLLCFAFGAARLRYIEAIKTLHGFGPGRTFVGQIAQTSAWYLLCGAVALTVSILALYAYNGWSQLLDFLAFASMVLFAGLIATAVVEAAVYCFTAMHAVPDVIAGHRPIAVKAAAAGLTQALATAMILLSASGLFVTSSNAANNAVEAGQWADQSDLVAVRFGLDLNDDGLDFTAGLFAPVIAETSKDGSLLLASSNPSATNSDGYDPDYGNRIVVNNSYLERQQIVDDSGHRIGSLTLERGEIAILVPGTLASLSSELEAEYRAWAEFNNSLPGAVPATISVRVEYIKSNQQMFNYVTDANVSNTQLDPIIVVVDPSSRVLPDSYYTAAASRGELLFENPGTLQGLIDAHDLERTVTSIYSAGDVANSRAAEQWRTVVVSIGSLSFLIVILYFSSVLLAYAYTEVTRSSQLARSIHGYSQARIHGTPLVAFAVIQGSLAGGLVYFGVVSTAITWFSVILLAGNVILVAATMRIMGRRSSIAMVRT